MRSDGKNKQFMIYCGHDQWSKYSDQEKSTSYCKGDLDWDIFDENKKIIITSN